MLRKNITTGAIEDVPSRSVEDLARETVEEDGDKVYLTGGPFPDPMCCYVGCNEKGQLKAELEAQLNLLRSCTLLKEILPNDGWDMRPQQVTTKVVLEALERLNQRALAKLLTTVRTVEVWSGPFADIKEHRDIFCEDWRLSIPYEGMSFHALLIDHSKTRALTEEELQDIIDFCAAFSDLDKMVTEMELKYSKNSKTRATARRLRVTGKDMRRKVSSSL